MKDVNATTEWRTIDWADPLCDKEIEAILKQRSCHVCDGAGLTTVILLFVALGVALARIVVLYLRTRASPKNVFKLWMSTVTSGLQRCRACVHVRMCAAAEPLGARAYLLVHFLPHFARWCEFG